MRGTDSSSAGKYEPELVDFPGLLPSHCSTQAQFSRRTEVPRFFAWCFPISSLDVSWFVCLMYPDCLMFPVFFFWCIPISWPDVSRFPCLIFTNVFAEYHSSFSPHGPLDFLRPGSFYNSNSLIWVRDFHHKILFCPVFSPPTSSFDILSK